MQECYNCLSFLLVNPYNLCFFFFEWLNKYFSNIIFFYIDFSNFWLNHAFYFFIRNCFRKNALDIWQIKNSFFCNISLASFKNNISSYAFGPCQAINWQIFAVYLISYHFNNPVFFVCCYLDYKYHIKSRLLLKFLRMSLL